MRSLNHGLLSFFGRVLAGLLLAASGRQAMAAVDFTREVEPILSKACYGCHGPDKQKNDLRLDQPAAALKGGENGPALVPGKSSESLLIKLVETKDAEKRMPRKGDPLTPEQIATLRAWIDEGAHWPASNLAAKQTEKHWSLQPLKHPAIPKISKPDWARTPIDHFILAKLDEKGLSPSEIADKRTLLRRIYFDLIGLPPAPDEIKAFLADESAQAYEKVVDNLLASPRYGERWARHWLDIAHYAETHGHDQDRPRTNAWPYRDYVIEAFNQDKPYPRFVEEQIAGDVLFPERPQAVVAMGFLATGPWDESSLRDIRDDTIDRQIARYLDRDDIVMTTMNTFVSSTVQCARCHNHKFDPISQAEYYGLQAVFAATDKGNRLYDADLATHRKRQELKARQKSVERKEASTVEFCKSQEFQQELGIWEKSLQRQAAKWVVLDPQTFTSAGSATLTKQADGSLLASGKKPETESYTIVANSGLAKITAVRVEVLTDDSLPQKGPGRAENGNLHLTHFRVLAAPQNDPYFFNSVKLQNPSADFNQQDWEIAKAIDNDPKTGWGIHPEEGKPHQAVFELKEQTGFPGGTTLTFVLDQNHGRGHVIGRVRLAVTDSPLPVSPSPLPDGIQKILATAAPDRTEEQTTTLSLYYSQGKLEKELKALPTQKIVYAGARDFIVDASFKPASGPREVRVLKRGDINQPGDVATPGALGFLEGLPARFDGPEMANEGNRRAALAKWITNPKNPLTYRSIVNRVWHYHFGRGIVDSPNDFGKMGSSPTHPELLDWLAGYFLQTGGSFKQLHKLILMSAVYQQSSKDVPKYAEADADNRYLWRMNRNRLDAESVRDTILQVTGKLDEKMGGPSAQQFVMTPGIHVTPNVDYNKFNVDSPESFRRSIYRFIFRTLPDPFMDSLDCADASQLTAARNTSVTALQALAMLNNAFVVKQSEHFAARLGHMRSGLSEQIAAACELAWGRSPTEEEQKEFTAYASKHGLPNFCRLMLNSNEFMFVN